jgi:hypothetical protein
MSTATKVSLGVGLGLGIPGILLVGVLLGLKIAQSRRGPYMATLLKEKIPEMADNREPVELYCGGFTGMTGTHGPMDRSVAPESGLISPAGS